MQLLPLLRQFFESEVRLSEGAKLVVEELSGKEIVELFWFWSLVEDSTVWVSDVVSEASFWLVGAVCSDSVSFQLPRHLGALRPMVKTNKTA